MTQESQLHPTVAFAQSNVKVHLMTFDEVIERYGCEDDMHAAYNSAGPEFASLNCRNAVFSVTVEPMTNWARVAAWIQDPEKFFEPEEEFEPRGRGNHGRHSQRG